MTAPRDPHAELERLIQRALEEQPVVRAPPALAARVRQAIERRSALPWWRTPLERWPIALRLALLACALGVLRMLVPLLATPVGNAVGDPVGVRLAQGTALARALQHGAAHWLQLGALVLDSVPRNWLYGGLALTVAMYATLFALAATAYRALAPVAEGGSRS